MSSIHHLFGREILDSRGNPTLEVQLVLSSGVEVKASVPSGASTGKYEAVELRDNDPNRYLGRGVLHAVHNVNGPLFQLLRYRDIADPVSLDRLMIEADGTTNKSRFGANAILGCSMAIIRAAAVDHRLPLSSYIAGCFPKSLPCPMMNVINGGAHAGNGIDFQEFMIRPVGAKSMEEAVRWGAEVFHTLKKILDKKGLATAVGDEGGFAPDLESDEAVLQLLLEAIECAGYLPGKEISLALDCAASAFYDPTIGMYVEKKKALRNKEHAKRSASEQIDYLEELCSRYPIDSIEDPLAEEDWGGWVEISKRMGGKIQIVGDDIFVTNPQFLQKGIELQVANAILIKPNQIGTVSETLETIALAKTHGYKTIISHRSGETEDSFIADLAVGTNAGQIKTGSLCRSERVAKYNRLLEIGMQGSVLYSA